MSGGACAGRDEAMMEQDARKIGGARSGFHPAPGHSGSSGSFCLYPPRVLRQVDVTEQAEGDTPRYVVRNRASSRYFLLKRTEYQVFSRIDGSRTLDQIAVPEIGDGPRASRQAVLRFLSKLDSMGLLARGGAVTETRAERGLYPRFRL